MKQGRRLYTCQLELIIYNIYIHLLSDRAMDAHYCVRCVVFPQEASRNHASDIGDRVALRGGALRGDDGVEDSHVPPRLQASDEAKGDPRFQARIHLHGHRLREAGESHGGPESQRTREDPSVALQKLSPRVSKLRGLFGYKMKLQMMPGTPCRCHQIDGHDLLRLF